ncbi:hypothetical protein [Trinickia acidisoli]|uniref:hypothetical protein n=1 Tax=Trinickia acidisoli TaxID=2767482 RepID=UPI001A8FB179|nr:hypothetical protein [Trinickia acidisoli]
MWTEHSIRIPTPKAALPRRGWFTLDLGMVLQTPLGFQQIEIASLPSHALQDIAIGSRAPSSAELYRQSKPVMQIVSSIERQPKLKGMQ